MTKSTFKVDYAWNSKDSNATDQVPGRRNSRIWDKMPPQKDFVLYEGQGSCSCLQIRAFAKTTCFTVRLASTSHKTKRNAAIPALKIVCASNPRKARASREQGLGSAVSPPSRPPTRIPYARPVHNTSTSNCWTLATKVTRSPTTYWIIIAHWPSKPTAPKFSQTSRQHLKTIRLSTRKKKDCQSNKYMTLTIALCSYRNYNHFCWNNNYFLLPMLLFCHHCNFLL